MITDSACTYSYQYHVELQDGTTDLTVFGGTFSGASLSIYISDATAATGTFPARWYMTTTSNPTQPLVYVNFNVVISACAVTSATQVSAGLWANF